MPGEKEVAPGMDIEPAPVKEGEIVRKQQSAAAIMAEENYDGIIDLSKHLDEIGKAKDKIRRFVLNRALKNDWMQFNDKLELGEPGAGRIASDLGVNFTNWNWWREEGKDVNGSWFRWYYSCTASCRGRILELIIGRADSRQKFFGYEKGAWKEIADVSESDIRISAWRCASKEGTKQMFGLRSIPVEQAAELGLDTNKIKKVTFDGSGNKGSDGKTSGELTVIEAVVSHLGQRQTANKKTVYVTGFTHDTVKTADTFSESLAKAIKPLIGKMVKAKVKKTQWGHNLVEIEEINKGSAAPKDAPKDHAEEEPKG